MTAGRATGGVGGEAATPPSRGYDRLQCAGPPVPALGRATNSSRWVIEGSARSWTGAGAPLGAGTP